MTWWSRPSGDTERCASPGRWTQIVTSARQRGLAWTPAAAPEPAVAEPTCAPSRSDGYLQRRRRRHLHQGRGRRSSGRTRFPAARPPSCGTCSSLRDTARALLDAEAASAEDTPQIGQLRADLDRRYDAYLAAYGPLNRLLASGAPAGPTRTPASRSWPGSGRRRAGSADDPFAPLVYALEEFDPVGQRAAKAAIFRQRVVAPRAPRLGADTPADALAICLDTRGRADGWPRSPGCSAPPRTTPAPSWARWCSTTREPGGWSPPPSTCPARSASKLRAAEQAAEDDSRFAVNVAELRKVQPARPDARARSTPGWARRGSSAAYVQQFLREILDDPRLRVEHPGGQIWAVRGDPHTVLARSTWGTSRYPAPQLAQAMLEQRRIEVRDTITRSRTAGSAACSTPTRPWPPRRRPPSSAERFADWAWEDPARAAAPGPHLQRAVQQPGAAQLRRRRSCPCPAWP